MAVLNYQTTYVCMYICVQVILVRIFYAALYPAAYSTANGNFGTEIPTPLVYNLVPLTPVPS
jgi:hypothetical protein